MGKFKLLILGFIFCVVQFIFRYSMVSGLAFMAAAFFQGCGEIYYNIIAVSYRQRIIPKEYLGRATTTLRFILIGSISLGTISGGFIAEFINYKTLGIILGIMIFCVGSISLYFIKDMKEPSQEEVLKA